ncbi:MAG: hypothetical protein ACRD2S_05435 [Terriglobales bacterium]
MAASDPRKDRKKKTRWLPLSLLATGFAGVGVVLFRGCWHRKMSWPVRSAGYCYQVCTGCGIKRLFDEESFRADGPFNYDLDRLIAAKGGQRSIPKTAPEPAVSDHRTAS